MAATTNAELSQQIGDVRQQIGALVEGQRGAERGRAVLHEKLDKLLDAVQTQALAVAEATHIATVASGAAAQARDRVDALDRELSPAIAELKTSSRDLGEAVAVLKKNDEDAAPLLDTVKQARNLLAVLLAIAGTTSLGVGTVFAFFNSAVKAAVLNWLGLA